MKLALLITLTVLLFAFDILAQQHPALEDKGRAEITFRVVSDEGKALHDVEVTASTFLRWQPGEGFGKDIYQETKEKTDRDGIVRLNFYSKRGDCHYGIYDIPGYYSVRNLEYNFTDIQGGKWQPWNPTIDVVLKPILNPIPMYARRIGVAEKPCAIPNINTEMGFDLMVADWVIPYGKGKTSDLIFTLKETISYVSIEKPFDLTLVISFANKGDGIQPVQAPINQGSDFRLPRYSPDSGYAPILVKQFGRTIEGKPINTGSREDQNYFFRVRTSLDKDGKIISALYGKIDGDIEVWGSRRVRFKYYLNPNLNDRNMEFDPNRNLFSNIENFERVTMP